MTSTQRRSAAESSASDDDISRLAERLGALARRGVDIGAMTTFRVGGKADLFVRVESIDQLVSLAEALDGLGVPVLTIGRGSNLLIADEGFRGLAIQLGALADDIEIDELSVRAGAGVLLPVLARRTAAAGLTGLEWAVGVPGSVGGGVRMNAGGHGSDIAASLVSAHVFELGSGRFRDLTPDEIGLEFRSSGLHDSQIVVAATFALERGSRDVAEAELGEIVRWRREHQPGGQNCGSVFVNPDPGKVIAAKLIDDLGLRGYRVGTAYVSEKHANFIQATEDGTASDVYALIEDVRSRVHVATGYRMRSEVRLVGFGDISQGASR